MSESLHHIGHVDGSEHHLVDTDYYARAVFTLNHVGGALLADPGEARFEPGRYLGHARPIRAMPGSSHSLVIAFISPASLGSHRWARLLNESAGGVGSQKWHVRGIEFPPLRLRIRNCALRLDRGCGIAGSPVGRGISGEKRSIHDTGRSMQFQPVP